MLKKPHIVKAMLFPVVVFRYESWTKEKAEHQRIDAFELWCWRRLLRVPWTPRRSNQSIPKEINPEYSSEGLMLKPKLQYFGNLMWRASGKDPCARKDWRQEEKGTTGDEMVGWHHWLNGHEFGWSPGVGDGQGDLACCGSWGRRESDTTEWLNWTEEGKLSLDVQRQHSVKGWRSGLWGRTGVEGLDILFQSWSWNMQSPVGWSPPPRP